ncbi:MAG: DUF2834 domain-containing protein [Elainellaceae cyanobacterium]
MFLRTYHKRLLAGVIWIGFIGYAFLLAPPDQPNTWPLIQQLSTGDWDDINPLIVSLFNLMGVWPLIYCCVLVADGQGQRVPAWIFLLGSFAVGAFALLPYLALRQPNPTFAGPKNLWLKLLDSRITGLAIATGASGFLAYGLIAGDWGAFIQQWQTSRFIHVMSLDFCLLCVLFPTVLGDDMARRGLSNSAIFWAVSLIPLIGPVVYLVLRPPLVVSPNIEATPGPSSPSVETFS